MRECGGTQVTAAKRLGINRNTLHKKWEQYKVDDRAARGTRDRRRISSERGRRGVRCGLHFLPV